MAVTYGVQTKALRDEAAGLRNLKTNLENEIRGMRSTVNQYLNMWDGQAKADFRMNVEKHILLLQAFTNNMDKFATALENNANEYADKENAVKTLVSDK